MSCEICGRGACTRSFHSLADQEAYDARQAMSDDVDTLRREIQDLRAEIAELKAAESNYREEMRANGIS